MISISITSDFDECSLEPSPCDQNADCTNSDGSYSCICRQGFTGDGRAVCEGVREYAVKSNPPRLHHGQLKAGFVSRDFTWNKFHFHLIESKCCPFTFTFVPRTSFQGIIFLVPQLRHNKHHIFLIP